MELYFGHFEKLEKAKSKTLDDVVALDRRFEMSKNKRLNSSGIGRSNRKEIVPDWLREDVEPTKKKSKSKTRNLLMKSVRDCKKC